jgi:hypothetical protein
MSIFYQAKLWGLSLLNFYKYAQENFLTFRASDMSRISLQKTRAASYIREMSDLASRSLPLYLLLPGKVEGKEYTPPPPSGRYREQSKG